MYSKTIVIGRLTADPELTYSGQGTAIGKFAVACDKYRKEDGADFYDVVSFKKLAENAAQYLRKGRLCMVEGRFSSRSYENSEGRKVRVWELIADNIKFLERADNGNGSNSGNSGGFGGGGDGNTGGNGNGGFGGNGGGYGGGFGGGYGGGNNDPFNDDGKPINISDDVLPF